MKLINRLYNRDNHGVCNSLMFSDENMLSQIDSFLKWARILDTDLELDGFISNITAIFNNLGISRNSSIVLSNMKSSSKNGMSTSSFNYSCADSESKKNDVIEYYASGESFLSSEPYSIYPGVKLTNGRESIYYSVGTVPLIRQYSIKINKDYTLNREYSKDEVFFIIESTSKRFVIKVKKPTSKVVTDNYELDNELKLVEHLSKLSGEIDLMDIYHKMCELSLGSDISVYPEMVLCESIKKDSNWVDTNVLSLKNGELDVIVRTVGDKKITCYGNDSWSYSLVDDDFSLKIDSGKTVKYALEAKSDKYMDDYTELLLKYDVSVARSEVEFTRRLVREKINGNRKG